MPQNSSATGNCAIGETHRRRDAIDDCRPISRLHVQLVDQEADLGEGRLEGVFGGDLGHGADDLGDRPERDAVAVRQASAADDVRPVRHRLARTP